MAQAFGWSARHIERELTDELLVMYLDEETDRLTADVRVRFDSMVEAVRAGTIFAHDGRQHQRWVRSRQPKGRALSGDALEAAVMRIAQMFPGNVIRGTA